MIVTVMYQIGPDQTFDRDYYLNTHMPLVREKFGSTGMTKAQVLHGVGTPSGAKAPYHVITLLEFPSMEAFGATIKQHGEVVMGDVPNFTNTQPTLQFNDVIG